MQVPKISGTGKYHRVLNRTNPDKYPAEVIPVNAPGDSIGEILPSVSILRFILQFHQLKLLVAISHVGTWYQIWGINRGKILGLILA